VILNVSGFEFEFENTVIKFSNRKSVEIDGTKIVHPIGKQNLTKLDENFVQYFLLSRHSVNNCRILSKTVLSRYFLWSIV
jgi:hypothetical protein